MTPTRAELTSSCMPGGGNAVDISLALLDDGDGIVGPRPEFSTNAAASPYHFIVPSPPAPSQEFLDFKTQAEKLILLATKLCSEEHQRAHGIWKDLGKKLLIHTHPTPRSTSTTSANTNSAEKSGGSQKPNSPGKHRTVSPGRHQANLQAGARIADQPGMDTPRNLEADLDEGEELLLQTTVNVRSPILIAPENEGLEVELPPNGPIKIMDENPPGEIILSSSGGNASNDPESDPLFDEEADLWKCKHCPAIFRDWITFQNHKPSHKKIYKCDQCDIVLTTRGNLNVHRRTHSGEKPFVCSKCAARFNNSGNLRRHVLTHQGLKPYNCSVCNSKFTEKKSLLIHQRSRHTGERPYVCPDCGQGFSQSSILSSHRLIHSNEKPFRCKCGHRFRQKSQLTLHEKRHAGIKNYSCSHPGCIAAFVTKADLDRHVRSHTGEKVPCGICGSTFMRKHTLKLHMRSQHS